MDEPTEGYEAFVHACAPRLRRAARLLTRDDHRADDLVAHALEKTYLRWGTAVQDPYAYARRIMVNASTDWWRRIGRREQPIETIGSRPSPYDGYAGVEHRDTLRRALAELTARERAVLVLRFLDDLPEQEVAQVLGIAVGTVKSTTHRALGKLRSQPGLQSLQAPLARQEA